MAHWRQDFLAEVTAQLVHLGLSSCVVCGGEEMRVQARPRVVRVGGTGKRGFMQPPDPEESFDHLIAVRCSLCGHVLLFDCEQYRRDGEEVLVRGTGEDEQVRRDGGR